MKPKRVVNKKLLKMIAEAPCTVCLKYPSDPHHITSVGAGGGDVVENVMPLCRTHHDEWHRGGPGKMIRKYRYVLLWLEFHKRTDVIERSQRSAVK